MYGVSSLGTPQKFSEATEISAKTAQSLCRKMEFAIGGYFYLYCMELHKTGNKKICKEYLKGTTIQNKIRLDA